MVGKDVRLGRLFSNGNAVIVAADHGSYMGPFKGIEDLPNQVMQFKKADALLLTPGMAKRCKDFFSEKDAPLSIIRVNWASHYCEPYMKGFSSKERESYYEKGYSAKLCSVKDAVSLGADLVIASLLLGTDEDANVKNITQFSEIVSEADSLGIPVIGEYIPFGSIDRFTGDISDLLLGVRACAEFGADIIKTVFTEQFDQVTASSTIPVLALGGGVFNRPLDAFTLAQKAIEKGAKGVVYGRNVICAEKPASFLDSLISVVKEGKSPEDAEKSYLETLK